VSAACSALGSRDVTLFFCVLRYLLFCLCIFVCFKYMVMSRDQNAGRIQSVRIDNSNFERVGLNIWEQL